MDLKKFAMLVALVVILVLVIPFGVMAQESPDTEVPPEAEHCLAQGMGALFVRGIWVCTPPSIAQATTETPVPARQQTVAQPEATEEAQPVLTAEQAERLVLEVLEPQLEDCTDAFLSGQLVSFLRTETYEDPDINQFGSKFREDLSEGLVVAVNSCSMLVLEGPEGRIRYWFAGWSVYDGTETVPANMTGLPTTFWWSSQGIVHQGNVSMEPVAFEFSGPQAFTAGAFEDNVLATDVSPMAPMLGGQQCVLAFQSGVQGDALRSVCYAPVASAG